MRQLLTAAVALALLIAIPGEIDSSPSGSSIGGQLPRGITRAPLAGERLELSAGAWRIVPDATMTAGGDKYSRLYN